MTRITSGFWYVFILRFFMWFSVLLSYYHQGLQLLSFSGRVFAVSLLTLHKQTFSMLEATNLYEERFQKIQMFGNRIYMGRFTTKCF